MNTGGSLAMTRVVLCAGALMLAGAFSDTNLALAQVACPLPAGMAPLAPPRVTAQQVEDGSASLMEFALAARDRYISAGQELRSLEEAAYLQCRVREEGSPWRSGSTYLVFLTPDGRVFEHAKSMALAGRKLAPAIYGAILQALGIDPASLAGPAAFQAALAAAAAGRGGAFNMPNIPGASGYAAVLATNPQVPILLAGFEIDEPHLAVEEIDYGDPAVTAADVVDRETLKAFVTESIKYFFSLMETNDPAAISKARVAMRDPNGPWRHGSVYLYLLERTSNLIFFHGAFPDRFEYRPLVPTVRDAVTGEFILPQIIEAAESSPEGGFVRYFFDDPTDATDNADIPKVGYARQFDATIGRPDGTEFTLDFIVGSGFYLSSPEVTAVRQNNVIEHVLPQIMRTMTASTVDAISGRIQQAHSGEPPAAAVSLGGASSFTDALLAHGRALGTGTLDLNGLLAGSSFTLPLNQNGSGGSGPIRDLTLWGSGDYRSISDANPQSVAYDGEVVSASLGVDTRLGENLLGGLSVALARGAVDYTDPETVTGELTTSLSSINPYVGWQSAGGGTSVWAAAGYGWGEVEVEESTGAQASDLTQQMVAAGVSRSLASSDQLIGGGTTSLRVKGETAFTQADIEGGGTLRGTTLDASRHRLMLEAMHVRRLASEATLTPSVEIGLRYDGGDGETGAGVEVGAGLGYSVGGLAVRVNARTLLEHDGADGYDEWGLSGLVIYQPRSDGQGLSMTLGSTWGVAHSGVQAMWSRHDARALARSKTAPHAAQRFQSELRYGVGGPMGRALWLPYVGADSGDGHRAVRLGVRLTAAGSLEAGVEIGRRESLYGWVDHAIELRGNMRL